MDDDELVRNDDAGPAPEDIRDERPIGAEGIRQLVRARCPELSLRDLEMAFSDSRTDSVLAEIADCVTDAIEELEARLDSLEQRQVNLAPRLQ
jgi:hypothetical protein